MLVSGVHEALVDDATARAARDAIASRRTREPSPLGPLLPPDRDPYLLRGVIYCAGCSGGMTTSASTAVTIENATEVPRYYRCRGSAERPACRPSVQVSASEVEAHVFHLLQHPDRVTGASPVARQVLEALVPVWPTLTRGENNEIVRLWVWTAMWDHEKRKVTLELDEIGLERFADQYSVELGLEPRD
ncbi:MAG: zinc ribbon domain-containing protein [Myxococcota bacterium]